mmetsp:Transcript_12866/g.38901  ORF Transcript_12866/g.38901 Transcript_12866/m.38901 type:complete len:109 (+) Transcript_12866:3142-3468(+)
MCDDAIRCEHAISGPFRGTRVRCASAVAGAGPHHQLAFDGSCSCDNQRLSGCGWSGHCSDRWAQILAHIRGMAQHPCQGQSLNAPRLKHPSTISNIRRNTQLSAPLVF